MNPVQATGSVDMPDGQTPSSSYSETFRISGYVNRLLAMISSGKRNDTKEICGLCVSLSRCIDCAVGNNEIPNRASELPFLLKQVCQWTNDTNIQTAIMVLMISLKGACENRWFSKKDSEEVHSLWSEMATRFCSALDINSGESTCHHNISIVLSRFYPQMKMGRILAFIEAMPGYGAFVKDFQITKNAKSPEEKVYLFVAQADNTETSSCIISPQLVNFLLNGKAVDMRTCICKDPGPQIPTDVTDLVMYGTNLLQAVGQFCGNYIIVVAFMSTITNPNYPALLDYVPPVTAASNSDEIVEGPSRISLNCPISFKRITTPVKGHLCKHFQCFDFENYVDINSRRPSWRCPHCSQPVCFTDIRIDQGMAKVLKEVGDTVSHVEISSDGSWEVNNEGDVHAYKQQEKSSLHKQPTPLSDMGGDVMDLTEGDNDIDASNFHQENEKKPSVAQLQDQPNPCDQIPSHVNMNPVHTYISPQMGNQFCRLPYENVTNSQGQTVNSGSNNMRLPTHTIGVSNTSMNPILQSQSRTHISASSMQFQQHSMNSMSSNYGLTYTTPNRRITRIPNAAQALPIQTPAGMVSDDVWQRFSASQMDRHQLMSMVAASMPENMGSQNWVHHDLSNVSTQPAQQFGAHSGSSYQPSGHHFNSYRQSVNNMIPNSVQPSVGQANQQAHRYVGAATGSISNQQTHHYANATATQAFHTSGWTTPVPTPLQTSLSSTPVMSLEGQTGIGQAFRTQEGSANGPADQNWRPTHRMRGSLSGQAYSEAFSRSIVHPTQPVMAANPPVLNTPRPFIPPHLQVLIANNINANRLEDGAGGSVLDGGGSS